MRARLFAKTGELAGASFEIGGEATLGRLPENQIVLPGALVSGRHGRIYFDAKESCYWLEDLGSRNGTFLAGSRIREPEKLGPLDVINFAGAFDFLFQVLEEGVEVAGGTLVEKEAVVLPDSLLRASASSGTLVEQLGDWVLPSPIPAAPRFALQVEREGGTTLFDLPPGEHVLGRGDDCAIAIDDRSLSRKHARLVVEGSRLSVADLGSTNMTHLAGKRVLDALVPVEPGADLLFGGVKATVIRK